jgi:hypothetical protein
MGVPRLIIIRGLECRVAGAPDRLSKPLALVLAEFLLKNLIQFTALTISLSYR